MTDRIDIKGAELFGNAYRLKKNRICDRMK